VYDRSLKVATVIESLEMEMELLCLTGVEDQLQADVRPTLETLRNAGIKVDWLGQGASAQHSTAQNCCREKLGWNKHEGPERTSRTGDHHYFCPCSPDFGRPLVCCLLFLAASLICWAP
jgi:hypothetical protein